MTQAQHRARALIVALLLIVVLALAYAAWDDWGRGGAGVNGCFNIGPFGGCLWTTNPHQPATAAYDYSLYSSNSANGKVNLHAYNVGYQQFTRSKC